MRSYKLIRLSQNQPPREIVTFCCVQFAFVPMTVEFRGGVRGGASVFPFLLIVRFCTIHIELIYINQPSHKIVMNFCKSRRCVLCLRLFFKQNSQIASIQFERFGRHIIHFSADEPFCFVNLSQCRLCRETVIDVGSSTNYIEQKT